MQVYVVYMIVCSGHVCVCLLVADPGVMALIEEWLEPLSEIRQMVLGTTFAHLDGPLECRLGECNLGTSLNCLLKPTFNKELCR